MKPPRMQLPERVELGRTPAKLGWQPRRPDAMLAIHRKPLESSEAGVAAHVYSSPAARTLHSLPCIHRRLVPQGWRIACSAHAKGWQTEGWHGVNWVASGERQRANGFERISNKILPGWTG